MLKLKKLFAALLLPVLAFCTAAFIAPSASATSGAAIQISPTKQTIDLEPGMIFSGTFQVKNTGDVAMTFTLNVAPYTVANDNYDPNLNTETNYTQISKWVTFVESGGTLAPGESMDVHYVVNTPEDVPAGGQYAALLAKMAPTDNNASIRVESQTGVLLFAHVAGETRQSGELVSSQIGGFQIGGQVSVSNTVKNTGNIDFGVTTVFSVSNFFNDEDLYSNEANATSASIMPDSSRYSSFTWDNTPSFGIFKVKQVVSFLDHEETKEGITIICPLWLILAVVFLIILIIVWLILRAIARRHDVNEVQF